MEVKDDVLAPQLLNSNAVLFTEGMKLGLDIGSAMHRAARR